MSSFALHPPLSEASRPAHFATSGQLMKAHNLTAASFHRLHLSLRLSVGLALFAVVLGVGYAVSPQRIAPLIPFFLGLHGITCLWASGKAFSASKGPLNGCAIGISLWLFFSLEAWLLVFMWGAQQPGLH